MNTLTISAILCSFAAAAFTIVISTKSLKDKRYRWFAILCSLISLWNFCFFFAHLLESLILKKIHLLLTLSLGICGSYSLIQFRTPFEKKEDLSNRYFTYSGLIGILLAIGLFLPEKNFYLFRHAANGYAILLMLYAFFLLTQQARFGNLSSQEKRQQIYFIVGGTITLIALTLNGFSETGLAVPSFGNVFLIIYLYFIYQTITKQKVLDLEDLIAKGVLFFVLAAILTLIYAILVSWVEGPALFIFNTFVASLVILILFEPLKSFILKTISDFFLKGHIRTEKKLEEVRRKLVETTDIRDLTHEVVVGLKDALNVTQAHFFLLDPEGIKFKLIRSLEPSPSKIKVTEVPVNHDFIKYLQRRHPNPANTYFIQRELVERGRSTPKERLENTLSFFQLLNGDVAFPFILDGKMLGFCTFITERSDTPYSLRDFELLIPLSRQIAFSLKNLEIYEQIRQRDRLATVGEMAAGLAHEIRNPLGAIKGAAQYLQPTQDNNPQNEFLKQKLSVALERLNSHN